MLYFNLTWILIIIAYVCPSGICIINGDLITSPSEFKYQVAFKIQHTGNAMSVCGGGILSDLLILTAAHCFDAENGNVFHKIDIRLHTIRNIRWVFGAIRRKIETLLLFKNWKDLDYDVAIVKVDMSLKLTNRPKKLVALRLPTAAKNKAPSYEKVTAVTAGYGINIIKGNGNNLKKSSDNKLRKLQVKIFDDYSFTPCSKRLKSSKKLCAAPVITGYAGFCDGDSGGPLVINKDKNNEETVGIIMSNDKNCNDNEHGGVYLRIAFPAIYNFITKIRDDVANTRNISVENVQSYTGFKRRDCI